MLATRLPNLYSLVIFSVALDADELSYTYPLVQLKLSFSFVQLFFSTEFTPLNSALADWKLRLGVTAFISDLDIFFFVLE